MAKCSSKFLLRMASLVVVAAPAGADDGLAAGAAGADGAAGAGGLAAGAGAALALASASAFFLARAAALASSAALMLAALASSTGAAAPPPPAAFSAFLSFFEGFGACGILARSVSFVASSGAVAMASSRAAVSCCFRASRLATAASTASFSPPPVLRLLTFSPASTTCFSMASQPMGIFLSPTMPAEGGPPPPPRCHVDLGILLHFSMLST